MEHAPSTGSVASRLGRLLHSDPFERRSALDERYAALDDVLAGSRRAVIYPAARMGRAAAARLMAMGVRVAALGDRTPEMRGTEIHGVPVLGPDEIAARHAQDVILVASTIHDSVIAEDLRARGCDTIIPVAYLNLRLPEVFPSRELDGAWDAAVSAASRPEIEAAYSLMADEASRAVFEGKLEFYLSLDKRMLDSIRGTGSIYFDRSIHVPREDEVFVDGGAYVGDTLATFLSWTSGRYRSYHAFEPDAGNFAQLAVATATDPTRIHAVMAGLGRESGQAHFLATDTADARLVSSEVAGALTVPIVSLDDYFADGELPTMIKMDIEGAEREALMGACHTISSASPSLAISAYHFPFDLWQIPLLMARLVPLGRIYGRVLRLLEK